MRIFKVGCTKLKGYPVERFQVPGNTQELENLADRLRQQPTKSERRLKHALYKLGYDFRFQHPLHGYIADFYFPHRNYIVELDGIWHKKRPDRDKLRDERLLSFGIRTLRIESDLVFASLPSVLKQIKRVCRPQKEPKVPQQAKKRTSGYIHDELFQQFQFVTAGL